MNCIYVCDPMTWSLRDVLRVDSASPGATEYVLSNPLVVTTPTSGISTNSHDCLPELHSRRQWHHLLDTVVEEHTSILYVNFSNFLHTSIIFYHLLSSPRESQTEQAHRNLSLCFPAISFCASAPDHTNCSMSSLHFLSQVQSQPYSMISSPVFRMESRCCPWPQNSQLFFLILGYSMHALQGSARHSDVHCK